MLSTCQTNRRFAFDQHLCAKERGSEPERRTGIGVRLPDAGRFPAAARVVELDGPSGPYFDGVRESTADPQAYDPDARRRLWEVSERLTAE
jgi:hypothetical protein